MVRTVSAGGAASSRGALTTVAPPRSGGISAGSRRPTLYDQFQTALKSTRSFVAGKENVHPLATFIVKNKNKSKGWLRDALPFKTPKKQMGERERTAMLISFSLFAGVDGNSGPFKGWTAAFANA